MLKVILLGTGNPTPRPHRYGSSYLVLVDDDVLMFDCGPGATHRLVATQVPITKVNFLFFTHHHFDHNADYAHFALARWDQGAGRTRALQVYGPKGTEELTEKLFGEGGAFLPDIKARLNNPMANARWVARGGTLPRTPPDMGTRDIQAGVIASGRNWQVTASLAMHVQPHLDCLAYRVDTDDGSVSLSGDTSPCKSVIDLARNADLHIHMCHEPDDFLEKAGGTYGFSGPKGAAQVAKEAGVKRLVLTHFGVPFDDPETLKKALEDAREIFKGEVIAGEDLMEITVKD